MSRIRYGVILAAGLGSRLQSIHQSAPKGFLEIGDQTIIESSISKLIRTGINKIIIVTGYQNSYYDELMNRYPFVSTIRNDEFATTGSMYSLWTARELIDESFLLLESDLIYELEALQVLMNSDYKDAILLSGKTGAGDEVYVGAKGNRVQAISKDRSKIDHLVGELVGISRISLDLYQEMVAYSEKQFEIEKNFHYEDCLSDLSSELEINFERVEDLAWVEIDDENHYQRAVEDIYPLVKKRDESFQIRKKVNRNILLNPGPATTSDSVKHAMVVEDICPREKEFGELVDGIRQDLVKIVHGENTHEVILFASSGTGGVEACLTSVVPDGKAVLVINNGAYGKRMQQICEGYDIEQIKLDYQYGDPVNLDEIERVVEEHSNKLSHIAFVHHETTVGILNPIDAISSIAEANNLEIIVDAMSSFAGIPIDVKKDNIHYLISSSNKCIQGMAGLSFVICNRASLIQTQELKRRNFYFNLYDNYRFFETKKQTRFTPPVQILYALRQAINEYFLETEHGRPNRYEELYKVLKEGLQDLGFRFLVDEKHHARLLTTVLEPGDPNFNFKEMHDYLYDRNITIYPGKISDVNTFRIANIGQLNVEDIQLFLKTLAEYLQLYNVKLENNVLS